MIWSITRQLRRTGRDTARLVTALSILSLVVALAGCNELIQVQAPSRVAASELDDPGNADLLVGSVAADFDCAFADYITAGGLVGNELEVGSTGIAIKEYDKRDFNPISSLYAGSTCLSFALSVYTSLSTARWQGDNTLELLEGWTDAEVEDRSAKMATVGAYSGYAQVLLGEAMCSAAFDQGPELTPAEIFTRAEGTFTRAITDAAGDATLVAFAHAGRARARARLGRLADAAADAQMVPDGFAFEAKYSDVPARRRNAVWEGGTFLQFMTIDPSYRNLTWDGVPDPRVDLTDVGTSASDGETALWVANKYPASSTPIPIASWEEAQLIIAEAEVAAGNLATAVGIINELHTRAGIPATFASSDAAEIMDHLVLNGRQRELFLESHHLGDVRQYNIPLTPAPGVPFKDGGGVYLDVKCFPLPEVERQNNPNIS